jgi:hypothetical protein
MGQEVCKRGEGEGNEPGKGAGGLLLGRRKCLRSADGCCCDRWKEMPANCRIGAAVGFRYRIISKGAMKDKENNSRQRWRHGKHGEGPTRLQAMSKGTKCMIKDEGECIIISRVEERKGERKGRREHACRSVYWRSLATDSMALSCKMRSRCTTSSFLCFSRPAGPRPPTEL